MSGRVALGPLSLDWNADATCLPFVRTFFDSFEHSEAPADLTIHLEATGRRSEARGEARFFHGLVRGYASPGGWTLATGDSQLRIEGQTLQGTLSPADLRHHELMLVMALAVALRRYRLFYLHAAGLVDDRGRGLLVAGQGGVGKSTTTLALLASGLRYLSDDALLLGPRLHGFPRPFHVSARTLSAFPALAPHAVEQAYSDKKSVDPRLAFPDRACTGLDPAEVDRILFPEIVSSLESQLLPCTRADALGRLLESSALLVIEGMAGTTEQMALLRSLCDRTRAYRLLLGRDALERPLGLAALVKETEA